MVDSPKFGATGEFPDGRLSPKDEGELRFGIAYDPETDRVVINFGKPISWMVMRPEQAVKFAETILKRVVKKE